VHSEIDFNYKEEEKTNYAIIWKRVVAWIVDTVIVISSLFFTKLIPDGAMAITSLFFADQPVEEYLFNYWVIELTIVLLVFWLYYALMECLATQATVGKMLFKIKVVNEEGEKISFLNASGRFLLHTLSLILLGTGHLFAIFTKRKQAVHEILSKSEVIIKVQ
jgi:uncharacterized RDD family membrane protein YckC